MSKTNIDILNGLPNLWNGIDGNQVTFKQSPAQKKQTPLEHS